MKRIKVKTIAARLLLTGAMLTAQGCTDPAPPQTDAAPPPADEIYKAVEFADLGLRFELPVTCKGHKNAQGTLFYSGPEDEKPSYSVLVQRIKKDGDGKPSALDIKTQLLKELQNLPQPGQVLETGHFDQGGLKGLRVETRFVQNALKKHKQQILIDTKKYVISISYNAIDKNFTQGLDLWKHLQASLRALPVQQKEKATK